MANDEIWSLNIPVDERNLISQSQFMGYLVENKLYIHCTCFKQVKRGLDLEVMMSRLKIRDQITRYGTATFSFESPSIYYMDYHSLLSLDTLKSLLNLQRLNKHTWLLIDLLKDLSDTASTQSISS
jgi:hypothetical protein